MKYMTISFTVKRVKDNCNYVQMFSINDLAHTQDQARYLLNAVHGPVLVAAATGAATAGEVRHVPPEG